MAYKTAQPMVGEAWALAERQHWVITRRQLLDLGFSDPAIRHRIARGRLHPIWRGVYAVGRPRLGRHGLWMAAVLACGPRAFLSHASAARLLEIIPAVQGPIDVSARSARCPRAQAGIRTHRRRGLADADVTERLGIPVTSPSLTLLDLAPSLSRDQLERAIGEADKRDLVDPESLRRVLEGFAGRPGVAALRETLDRHTFTLTDSELERHFLPIARQAGLSVPLTQQYVNGFRVDFYWPDLGLVVETDGLRYHRTAAQQAEDRRRDQAHAAAGLTPLRFTRFQVRFEPDRVQGILEAVAARLYRAQGPVSTGPLARPRASRTIGIGTP
jgi:very-short-patch-repair endonuclease